MPMRWSVLRTETALFDQMKVSFATTGVFVLQKILFASLIYILLIRIQGLDGAVGIVFEFGHFHIAQVGLPGNLHVVVKQVPFAFELDDGVVVGPTPDGF